MVKVKDLHHAYGSLEVLEGVSFEIKRNAITCLLGPSGCGKTTLLNLISGAMEPQTGTIEGAPSDGMAYLFQEPRLLPWMSLRKNVELVLKNSQGPEQRRRSAEAMLKFVDLESFADYYPRRLSGGMRQRGALARAFAFPSELLLMDEPFQALDPALKLNLIADFRRLWEHDHRTALLVTHNIQEATLLADHIVVLSDRPSRIIHAMDNPVGREYRVPYGREVLELERELFQVLSGEGGL